MTALAAFVTLPSPGGDTRVEVPRLAHGAKQPALRREQEEAERTFRLALRLCETTSRLRAQGEDALAASLEGALTEYLDTAPPVRVGLAAEALGVRPKVVQGWIHAGVLDEVSGAVNRVTVASVLKIWPAVADLRAAGRSRNLVAALQSRLENEELWASPAFRESLDQMHRGERGAWPEDFD